MKILYTTTSYLPATGGAQQHLHEIARRLSQKNDVHVIRQWNKNRQDWLLGSTVFSPEEPNEVIDGVQVDSLNFSKSDRMKMAPFLPLYYGAPQFFSPPIAKIFLENLKRKSFKPDLIHHGRIGRENLALASYQLSRELKVPFFLTPFHHPRWVGWRYKLYLDLYKKADHLFALTESEKNTLESLGVAPSRITVIGHGPTVLENADGDRFRQAHQIGAHPMVLFLGQKYAYKGFAELAEAASEVWKSVPETRFVFIGPRTPESEALFRQIKDPRVIELGAVPLQEKCDALKACTVFVMPSTQESFGGVYVEAWMYGKPVIGGSIPAIAGVIDEGQNGLLVKQNSSEISKAIQQILLNPSLAREFGNNGKQKALTQYGWNAIVERLFGVYSHYVRAL